MFERDKGIIIEKKDYPNLKSVWGLVTNPQMHKGSAALQQRWKFIYIILNHKMCRIFHLKIQWSHLSVWGPPPPLIFWFGPSLAFEIWKILSHAIFIKFKVENNIFKMLSWKMVFWTSSNLKNEKRKTGFSYYRM